MSPTPRNCRATCDKEGGEIDDPRPPATPRYRPNLAGQARSDIRPPPPEDAGCEDPSEPVDDRHHRGWAPISLSVANVRREGEPCHRHPCRLHGLCQKQTPLAAGRGDGLEAARVCVSPPPPVARVEPWARVQNICLPPKQTLIN
jgi:hypothetical protein